MRGGRGSFVVAGAVAAIAACNFGLDVSALQRCEGRDDGDCALVSDAGGTGDAGDGEAAPAPCPTGKGPAMARVAVAGDGDPKATFCVDVTEVRNDDYAAFLASAPTQAPAGASQTCRATSTFVPAAGWPPAPGRGAKPVTHVDFCEAEAYCLWAGKSLCGDVRGGPLDSQRLGDPSVDAWALACGGAERRAYPYGSSYDPSRCNGVDRDAGGPVDVGSLPTCTAADSGVLDLSGNVWEWTDACDAELGDSDQCWLRGGAFNAPPVELACASRRAQARGVSDDTTGFRCCAR